jgi:hypothetical protein
MSKFKLATIGCSHSSYYAGLPWPIPLAQVTNCQLKMAYSAGAGNEINVLKIHELLDKYNPNLLVVQLTDPNRFTVGLDYDSSYKAFPPEDLIGPFNHKNTNFYTFNHTENIQNLVRMVGTKFHGDLDKFIINHIIPSEYNMDHKIVATMLAMDNLAKMYNVPLVFFAWTLDIKQHLIDHGYEKLADNFNIIPSYIEEFVSHHNLKGLPTGHPAQGHHDTKNHIRIATEFVLPYLLSKNLIPKPTKSIADLYDSPV